MKNYDKNKEPSNFKYWKLNDLYEREMSEKSQVNGFMWVKNTFQYDEDFIETILILSEIVLPIKSPVASGAFCRIFSYQVLKLLRYQFVFYPGLQLFLLVFLNLFLKEKSLT